ncbi:MAG: thiol-disulfide oxidoreductase DCC family protein [Ignavibacteriaceae bacterium]
MNQNSDIILFDGVCNFCNFWVNFIIKRDNKSIFKFASLQSEAGIRLADKYSINKKDIDSVILIRDGKYLIKSEAALEIAKELTPFYKIFYYLKIIPRSVRDFIYDLIAKNRYAIFGKRNTCRIPTEEEKRFII